MGRLGTCAVGGCDGVVLEEAGAASEHLTWKCREKDSLVHLGLWVPPDFLSMRKY